MSAPKIPKGWRRLKVGETKGRHDKAWLPVLADFTLGGFYDYTIMASDFCIRRKRVKRKTGGRK